MIFDGDRDRLNEYVRHMADLCGLRDWTIRVDSIPADDECDGQMRGVYGRKFGILRLGTDWAEREPDALRNTITHELLHLHTEPMHWAVNNVHDVIGAVAFTVLEGSFRDALEMAIDGIATAWAETLPLPIDYAEHVEVGGE